jgi:Fe-S cluster biogenesis protein NfuA
MSTSPDSAAPDNQSVTDQVAAVIETIRPAIQGDGGDLELIGVDDQGVVQVRFHGACVGCPSASMTLTMGVERMLKEKVPQVTKVVLA